MIRNAVNRLLMIAIVAALTLFALFVAIEAGHQLAGGDGHLGPVDYRSAWQSMQDWDPSQTFRTLIFALVALGGLILLVVQIAARRRGPRTVEVARGAHGPLLVEEHSVASHVRRALGARDWVRSPDSRVRLNGRAASLRARPRASRPWELRELTETREQLTADLKRFGLDPTVEIEPRAPQGRGTKRVR